MRNICRGCKVTLEDVYVTVEGNGGAIDPAGYWHIGCYSKIVGRRNTTPPVDAPKSDIDAVYLERNQVVAGLAAMALVLGYKAGIKQTSIEGWDHAWHGCVYVDLPSGQCSWHHHSSQADLFSFLPEYDGEWDGHDTPEKYRRVLALTGKGD